MQHRDISCFLFVKSRPIFVPEEYWWLWTPGRFLIPGYERQLHLFKWKWKCAKLSEWYKTFFLICTKSFYYAGNLWFTADCTDICRDRYPIILLQMKLPFHCQYRNKHILRPKCRRIQTQTCVRGPVLPEGRRTTSYQISVCHSSIQLKVWPDIDLLFCK